MRFVSSVVLAFALMVGSSNAGECASGCTPVRTVVSSVVSTQPVRSLVGVRPVKKVFCRVRAVQPLKRLLSRIRRCC